MGLFRFMHWRREVQVRHKGQRKSKQKHLIVVQQRLIKVSIYICSRCPAFDLTHFRSVQIASFFPRIVLLVDAVVGGRKREKPRVLYAN